MNCRPGDLAVIVSSKSGRFLGRMVTCVEFVGDVMWEDGVMPTWRIDRPLGRTDIGCWPAIPYDYYVPDRILRPIRPQSDDAQDESHAYLPPVPTHDRETA